MKKIIFAAVAAFGMLTMASCSDVVSRSAPAIVDVQSSITSTTLADLEVGERTNYVYNTKSSERSSGIATCKASAVAALLRVNGNADVLVAPDFNYDSSLNTIEVSGRPAKYKNFRTAQ